MILVVGDVVDDIGVRPLEPINPRSDTRAEIRSTPGGSAANTAAWLGHLGAPVRFAGKCGTDGVVRHEQALRTFGVDARLIADPDLPTATIVLTLDADADRTMYVDRAANATLRVEDLVEDVWDDVTWLHLTGYTFFDPQTRPVARHLIDQAQARGAGVSVDPSSAGFLAQCGVEAFTDWTGGVDLIVPNLEEARLLAGATGPSADFEALLERYPQVVVTLGPLGAAHLDRASRTQVAAPRGPVLDTIGAGDAFFAGFLSRWLTDRDPDAALNAGSAAAERCITIRGARPSDTRA